MKILHIITSCDPANGGPIEGIKQLYKFYKKYDLQCEILSSDYKGKKFLKDKRLPKVNALGPSFLGYGFNPKMVVWLRKNILNYDFLIVDGIWQYHNYAVWKVAKEFKKPYYLFTHGMLDPWFNQNYPLKHLKKIIYWWLIQYRILKDAKSLLFTTSDEKILARQSFSPYKVREKVIGYGISKEIYNSKQNLFLKKYPKLKNKKIFLFLGRVQEKKGLDNLIRAIKNTQNFTNDNHLVIIGPSSEKYKKKLVILKNKLKLDSLITFLDPMYNNLKYDVFKCSKFFCLTSHQENFGISIVEALSHGIPVLITNKVNIWREIKNNHAGFVCDDNIDSITKNLNKMIFLKDDKYKLTKANALRCYKNNFNSAIVTKKFVSFLKNDH